MEAPKIYRARQPWAHERRDVDWRPTAGPTWFRFGLCRQMDPDLFFPEPNSGNGGEAKEACGMCPVRNLCLEWALNLAEDDHGILAGTSPKTRQEMRQQRTGVAA